MPIRGIITGESNPLLRGEMGQITSFGRELRGIVRDITETVEHVKGAGLAAPQIAVRFMVTVAKLGGVFVPLINPEIIWRSEDTSIAEEGCLSLPNVWVHVPRSLEVIVRFQNERGKEQERLFREWDARVLQHEVDHLHGKLIVDYR